MNVVLIDDDEAFLRSARILFRCLGHNVMAFTDPRDAAFFLGLRTPVDALVIDYVLPGETGTAFLERVRGLLPPRCKVILISGHTDWVEALDLEEMGVTAFLPKPLDLDRFCCLLELG